MKKVFVTILALLYLTASVGATVHLHYCMDQLVDWSLASDEGKACGNCGMDSESSKGCCKDEPKQVKLQSEQKITGIFTLLAKVVLDVSLAQVEAYKLAAYSSVVVTEPASHAPPDLSVVPVYLSNRVFRI